MTTKITATIKDQARLVEVITRSFLQVMFQHQVLFLKHIYYLTPFEGMDFSRTSNNLEVRSLASSMQEAATILRVEYLLAKTMPF